MHYNWEAAIWFAEGVKISWCLSDRVQNLKDWALWERGRRGRKYGWMDRKTDVFSFGPSCIFFQIVLISSLGIQYVVDQQTASTLGENKQMRNHRVKLLILIYEVQWSFQDKYFCMGIVLNCSVYLNVLKLWKKRKGICGTTFFLLNYLPGWLQASSYRFWFFMWKL